jgi:(E)-4-hydroxy-3-methyl-but-2-enyl pyrophosphate reductase
MDVIIARSAGFCWGVRRAVDRARKLARETGSVVHTDGPLMHNREMMNALRSEGIVETDDPHAAKGGTLLIRAHGIAPERRAMLKTCAARLVDATCPDVARTQGLIQQHARRGCSIVIFGDPGHAEVVGLLGYAGGRGFVISDLTDVAGLPELSSVCLVSQSTQFPTVYADVAKAIRQRFADVCVLDTICVSTKSRQEELVALAARVDAIVVVGGSHSANTLRLVSLAQSLRPTFHIQTADQLTPEDFRGISSVAVTGGASTPDFIISEVKSRLESFQ